MIPSNLVRFFIGKNQPLEKLLKSENLENFSIIKMEQTHSDDFAEVSEENFLPEIRVVTIPKVDAVITTKKNILLSVKTADCLPILIYWENGLGSNSSGVAAIHSGRAGTEKKILTKVLLHLKNKYQVGKTEGDKLTVWLGPAICKNCYQIDRKTNLHYDLYQKNIDQIRQVFPKFKSLDHDGNTNIRVIRSKHCTLHNNDLFYSYRKTGKGVKMNYSLIGLN
jgi:YfiH family protein